MIRDDSPFASKSAGAIWMHEGELRVAFRFTISDNHVAAIDLIGDPDALARTIVER